MASKNSVVAVPVFDASCGTRALRAPTDLLGEGPVWDQRLGALFWVDILAGAVSMLVPKLCWHQRLTLPSGDHPGFCVPVASRLGVLLCGSERGLFEIDVLRPHAPLVRLGNPDRAAPRNRFNDAKVAPCGRLFAGTLQTKQNARSTRVEGSGTLFCVTDDAVESVAKGGGERGRNGQRVAETIRSTGPGELRAVALTDVVGGVTISNGLAFDAVRGVMYFIDTATMRIARFSYNPRAPCSARAAGGGRPEEAKANKSLASPTTSNVVGARLEPIDFARAVRCYDGDHPMCNANVGRPDGMCIDANGNLWVAAIGAGRVVCIEPSAGEVVAQVVVPTPLVTSCCFGGERLETLYITTARGTTMDAVEALDAAAETRQGSATGGEAARAGLLYAANVGVRGAPTTFFGARFSSAPASRL